MKKVKFTLIAIYKVSCFVACGYVVYWMSDQFVQNRDAAGIRYKKFGSNEDNNTHDDYPTFSFCFLGSIGTQYFPLLRHELFYNELYHLPPCQKSEVLHDWCEVRLYQNMLLGKERITPNASLKNFDDITIDTVSNVTRWELATEDEDQETKQIEHNSVWLKQSKHFLFLSYQDSHRICLTKGNLPGHHIYDTFSMSLDFFERSYLSLEVYVHQVGGLISQIGRRHVLKTGHDNVDQLKHQIQRSNSSISVFNEIRIKTVEVLHKRQGAEDPCNEKIHDNDKAYKEAVMKYVGCIPPFWKKFTVGNLTKLPPCTQQHQFKDIRNMLPNVYDNNNIKNGTKLYVQPCYDMSVSVTTTTRHEYPTSRDQKPSLFYVFYYEADNFKEIVNHQAFTIYDLWSQIGGFVGIFLGYALLQVVISFLAKYEV